MKGDFVPKRKENHVELGGGGGGIEEEGDKTDRGDGEQRTIEIRINQTRDEAHSGLAWHSWHKLKSSQFPHMNLTPTICAPHAPHPTP